MNISRGRKPGAKKIVVYGPEGIGKTTFASQFPGALFIDTEDSSKELDVARFDKPTSWSMLLEEAGYVKTHSDVCQTLVIDTADWAERLEIDQLCKEKGWSGLEDPGYGKGYQYSAEKFGAFLDLLSEIVEKGINVVITAHAQLRKVELPEEIGAYDHWEMKTSRKVAPMIREWADAVFFANYKTMVIEVDKKKKAQGGKRIMYANHTPFWDAKNRYGLPDSMPFSFDSIKHLFTAPAPSATPAAPAATAPTLQKAGVMDNAPVTNATKSGGQPEKEVETKIVQQDVPVTTETKTSGIDERIPKALRDLMEANNVSEWDIQQVVSARGYFPYDMPVRDYPADFIDGCLVGAWQQVNNMITEMKEKQEIPFN